MTIHASLSLTMLLTALGAAAASAQQPLPVLQYNPPANFYKGASTNPEEYSSTEVNASVQVYPFRPFTGNIQVAWQQTLLRDWIDSRYRETNVATQPVFSSDVIPGAQAVLIARFVENAGGLPREHSRLVIVAGGAAAIVDLSANSAVSWQRAGPAMTAMLASIRVVAGVALPPPMTPGPSPAGRAHAGIYMGYKQRFMVNLQGAVGTGTFPPAPHFYLFSPEGRVYRTFDILNVPQNDPGRFDFATAARNDPDNSGQFVVQGDHLIMQFGGGTPETIQAPLSRAGSFTVSGVTYSRQ